MSITKILSDETVADEEKLATIIDILKSVRTQYGNEDLQIPDEKVNTSHGLLHFSQLADDAKVEILLHEMLNIRSVSVAFVEAHPGAILDQKVVELLALNPFFANIETSGDQSAYI